jgi:two-component system response regulator PilR (NtrC family)
LHMQVKLLRAIQEKAVRPLGAQREIPTDVRILSATHKNLGQLVESGQFRQDLYYRLNVIQLQVPALRERREDIPMLADHCLNQLARRDGHVMYRIDDGALEALTRYQFPGNVRELENILERATTLCDGTTISATDLQLPDADRSEDDLMPEAAVESRPGALQLDTYMNTVEKEVLLKTLEQTRYNKTAAAKLLGISFRALRYRLKKLGLE